MNFGPLFLPAGSVRAILAILIVAGVVIMALKGMEIPNSIGVAFGLVIGLYFRDSQIVEINRNFDELRALREKVEILSQNNNIKN